MATLGSQAYNSLQMDPLPTGVSKSRPAAAEKFATPAPGLVA